MNDLIKNNNFDGSADDMKLKFFLEQCLPHAMATDDIKLKTHLKIARLRRRRIAGLCFLAIAASISLALVLTLPFGDSLGTAQAPAHERLKVSRRFQKTRRLVVPVGEVRSLLLPDGTKIIANSRTSISYPEAFAGKLREISVNGEAYIEVAHDSAHPFIVHGNGFSLKVLGTKFNVNTYEGKASTVALLEGAVEVKTRNADAVRLHPDNLVRINSGAVSELIHASAAEHTSWTEGFINLYGQTVEQVASQLEDFYGISILCSPNVANVRLYGKMHLNADCNKTLRHVTFLSNSRCIRQGNIFKILR